MNARELKTSFPCLEDPHFDETLHTVKNPTYGFARSSFLKTAILPILPLPRFPSLGDVERPASKWLATTNPWAAGGPAELPPELEEELYNRGPAS